MAILTFAFPVSGLRGKVGGIVYSANKSGPYLKAWGKGANPRTTIQTEQRGVLGNLARNWQLLTAGERTGWNTYAALSAQDKTNSLGETFSISGFNWYVAINSNLIRAEKTQRTAAPTTGTPAQPTIQDVRLNDEADATDSRVRLTSGSTGLTETLILIGRVVQSSGPTSITIGRNWLASEVPGTFREVLFQDTIDSKFGTIQVGQVLFIEVATMSDQGRIGPVDSRSVEKA